MSTTSATTRPTSTGSALTSTIATTTCGRSRPASATSSEVAARSIALLIAKGLWRVSPIRSVSVTMPVTAPSTSVTGKWCTPSANIRRSASPAGVWASSVIAGKVATASTGVSKLSRTATTRVRRSRSVTMPHPPRIGTSSEETRSSAMRSAAADTVVVGSADTAGRRTSVPIGASRASGPSEKERSEADRMRRRIDPITNAWPAEVSSSSSATSSGIR